MKTINELVYSEAIHDLPIYEHGMMPGFSIPCLQLGIAQRTGHLLTWRQVRDSLYRMNDCIQAWKHLGRGVYQFEESFCQSWQVIRRGGSGLQLRLGICQEHEGNFPKLPGASQSLLTNHLPPYPFACLPKQNVLGAASRRGTVKSFCATFSEKVADCRVSHE